MLVYRVRYAKGEADETLTFIASDNGGEPKIVGHRIISPALVSRRRA